LGQWGVRTMTRLVMLAVVPMASLVLGCGPTTGKPVPPAVSPQVSAQRTYALPANFCHAVDWSPFTELYPGQKVSNPEEVLRIQGSRVSQSECIADLIAGSDDLLMTIAIDVYGNVEDARISFDGLKGADFKTADEPKEVAGIRDSAYTFIDRRLGPRLVVLHANARVAAWAHFAKSGNTPPDVFARLKRMIEYALDHMPST